MTIAFWSTAALLLLGAILFVLPPLLRRNLPATDSAAASPLAAYRDQRAQIDADLAQGTLSPAQHALALEELQARVLEEVGEEAQQAPPRTAAQSPLLLVAVAVLIPAGALGTYGVLGTPAAIDPRAIQAAEEAPHSLSQAQMEAMVEGLAEKLRRNPNDAAGWYMLARSYVAFDWLAQAAEAFDRAAQLAPNDPQVLADYADVLAMVNGRNLEGRPTELVMQALRADPTHQKSLSLAGTAAFNRGEYAQAAEWWQKLLATVPPGSEEARAIQASLDQAHAGARQSGQALASAGASGVDAAAAPATAGAAGATVQGSVTVADTVRASMAPGATLFVYARPADGARMPLAIMRVPADSFPLKFKLDDSSAMTPQARLSMYGEVVLMARVSRSGDATPQPGDLQGTVGPVKVGARDVRLVIDEVVK